MIILSRHLQHPVWFLCQISQLPLSLLIKHSSTRIHSDESAGEAGLSFDPLKFAHHGMVSLRQKTNIIMSQPDSYDMLVLAMKMTV